LKKLVAENPSEIQTVPLPRNRKSLKLRTAMSEHEQTIQRLKQSIEDAKMLRREIEQRIKEMSKLIESAEALRRGMRVISEKDHNQGSN